MKWNIFFLKKRFLSLIFVKDASSATEMKGPNLNSMLTPILSSDSSISFSSNRLNFYKTINHD